MHTVAIAVFDDVVASDLSTPFDVFRHVRLPNDMPAYRVRVCGTAPVVTSLGFSIQAPGTLADLPAADTIVVPGLNDLHTAVSEELLVAIRMAAERGARVASICTGAFVLAAAGLLDRLRATTHWLAAGELARRYPSIDVDPNVLYVDNGNILTSAGAAAGHDLCLHIVRRDYGAAIAAHAARVAVMPLERDGGQAQFIVRDCEDRGHRPLDRLLAWMEENLHQPLSLDDIARQSAMSKRTLNRRFVEQLGSTPMQWLLRLRVRRAQHLLETTHGSLERIVSQAGFGSSAAFRKHFHRVVGTSPQAYRRAFGHRATR